MPLTLVYIDATHRLAAPAAAQYLAMLAAGCPAGCVTSAYRPPAEQEAIFRARYTTTPVANVKPVVWLGRKWYKRPGVPTAAVPGTSKHEQGLALDLANPARTWVAENGAPFGWTATVSSEPWHFEFDGTGIVPVPLKEVDMIALAFYATQKGVGQFGFIMDSAGCYMSPETSVSASNKAAFLAKVAVLRVTDVPSIADEVGTFPAVHAIAAAICGLPVDWKLKPESVFIAADYYRAGTGGGSDVAAIADAVKTGLAGDFDAIKAAIPTKAVLQP